MANARVTVTMLAAWALALTGCAQGDGERTPRGWRALTEADLGPQEAQAFRRSERGTYLEAAGDYDGDGQPDRAGFLVREQDGRAGLFFFLANGRPVLADTVEDITYMGINAVAAGEVVPGCPHGAQRDCNRQTFVMPRDGVELFLTESAVTYYYFEDGEITPVMSWRGVR